MKLDLYDSSSLVLNYSTMSQPQFHLDSSSVIKTAPPGRQQHDFSPKNEPIDLAPLTQPSLQDLSKMQPIEQYYSMPSYPRVYSEYAIGLAHPATQTSIITAPSTAGPLYYPTVFQGPTPQEWNRPMVDNYNYQRTNTLQYSQEVPPQQQQQQQQERVYKSVEMPSPVDSGIGADLSMMAQTKDDFYNDTNVLHTLNDRPERTLSHRDSPIIIPKMLVV